MSNAPKRHVLGKENTEFYKPHEHVDLIYILLLYVSLL